MSEQDESARTDEPVESSPEAHASQRHVATPRRRRPLLWWTAGIGVVVAILLVLPVVSVLEPGYYRRYPALGQRMDHWATSTHSRISCAECHVGPGIGGPLSFSTKAIPAFYSQLLDAPDDTNLLKAPGRAACRKCHTSYRRIAASGDLLIPHKAHVQVLGIECVECHQNLVHSLNRRGFNRPEMETCLTCHDGDRATDKCQKCHTRKHRPASHAGKDWLVIHGRVAKSQDCGGCHGWTPGYCAVCHARRPASHAGNWKKGHALVATAHRDGCLVCHRDKKFCDQCH